MTEDIKQTAPEAFDGRTDAQLKEELDALILEERRLDLEIKREQVSTIKAKRAAALETARAQILSTKQFMATRAAIQARCNHRKGGTGAQAVIQGAGTSPFYAVVKHVLPIGKVWVQCQRCGKEWHPANPWNVEVQFRNGQPVAVIAPTPATPGWEAAVDFPCDNTMSASSRFIFEKVDLPAEVAAS